MSARSICSHRNTSTSTHFCKQIRHFINCSLKTITGHLSKVYKVIIPVSTLKIIYCNLKTKCHKNLAANLLQVCNMLRRKTSINSWKQTNLFTLLFNNVFWTGQNRLKSSFTVYLQYGMLRLYIHEVTGPWGMHWPALVLKCGKCRILKLFPVCGEKGQFIVFKFFKKGMGLWLPWTEWDHETPTENWCLICQLLAS